MESLEEIKRQSVEKEYLNYLDKVGLVESQMSEGERIERRACFYAGYGSLLLFIMYKSEPLVSEEVGYVLNNNFNEVTTYFKTLNDLPDTSIQE